MDGIKLTRTNPAVKALLLKTLATTMSRTRFYLLRRAVLLARYAVSPVIRTRALALAEKLHS